MTATSTSLVAISDVAATAMLNNAWSVWQSAWFGHGLGPLGGGQQRSMDIKSRCVTYVSAVTFNWLSKRSNCNHVSCTVEPRFNLFNEPLYNEVLGITNDIHQPGRSYSEMYGTEPRKNEILVITSTIQKPKHKKYPDITNKCQHVTKY